MRKKFNSEIKEYEALEKHLMALYRSGVYITSKDVLNIAKELSYEDGLKERETALRNLLIKAKKEKNLVKVFDALAQIIDERVGIYEQYASDFEAIQPLVKSWKQRAKNTKMILYTQKQKALSEAYDDDKRD